MSERIYNLEIMDSRGNSIKRKGIKEDDLPSVRTQLKHDALSSGWPEPLYFVTHQIKTSH
jgi:hypothetical protein